MKRTELERLQAAYWTATHRDMRGTREDGIKTVAVYRQGTTLIPIGDLTRAECIERLPIRVLEKFGLFTTTRNGYRVELSPEEAARVRP